MSLSHTYIHVHAHTPYTNKNIKTETLGQLYPQLMYKNTLPPQVTKMGSKYKQKMEQPVLKCSTH